MLVTSPHSNSYVPISYSLAQNNLKFLIKSVQIYEKK